MSLMLYVKGQRDVQFAYKSLIAFDSDLLSARELGHSHLKLSLKSVNDVI